jgi:hypothetical protein
MFVVCHGWRAAGGGPRAADNSGGLIGVTIMTSENMLEAIKALAGAAGGVKLSRLCAAVSHRIQQAQAAAILLELEKRGLVVLYPFDSPRDIQPEDRESAVHNSMGAPRHIVYLAN